MNSPDPVILSDVRRVAEAIDLSPFAHAKVLLAGANGLIGSYFAHLLYHLNASHGFGIEVDLISRSAVTEQSRIYALRDSPGFRFVRQDLSAYTSYERPYDFMIHAAGYGAPAQFLQEPLKVMDVNYIGLKSMLESARAQGTTPRVLYLSSSEVYGSPTVFPTPETYPGNSPVTSNRACYVESKRLSEVLALAYGSLYDMPVKIARPALSYGPGMPFSDTRVMSQFIRKAHEEREIRMLDDGRDLRCYCYMSDVLRQLAAVLLYGREAIYNVGSAQEEISIRQLAEMIGELMGARVIPGPGKNGAVAAAPSRVCLDMRKLEHEFGFTPAVPMAKGLKNTIDWSLAHAKNESPTP
ncbi:MAG: NAD-dependent epimerase/dehydratase family protein [Patescibacteria group bacterium]|nr:NAD-dependent epimerase/dehydratase family protein [Patescibacteria group bacterium]MDE1944000.1 NAD-dependent epimerase/dehydratase family protein [Patescibacteria group bacterium]MDE1945070.1 NAD-dependent epimerase/dehydratase family protein [Patescibacteria group bacterium]MDE2057938.1 NAD-dependent epimerase/dehydratase family protein [Patescibacteria group bacterium]